MEKRIALCMEKSIEKRMKIIYNITKADIIYLRM